MAVWFAGKNNPKTRKRDEQRETQTINTRQVMKGEETGGNTAGTNDETKKLK